MICKNLINLLLFSMYLSLEVTAVDAAELFTINAVKKTVECHFKVNACGSYISNAAFHLTAAFADQAREYSICRIDCGDLSFPVRPLAPEMVTVNGIQEQKNPLFNQKIEAFCIMGIAERLAVIRNCFEPIIYVIDRQLRPDGTALYAAGPIRDAHGEPAYSLTKLAAADDSLLFAAATGRSSSSFNDSGSGIVAMRLVDFPGEKNVTIRKLVQIDLSIPDEAKDKNKSEGAPSDLPEQNVQAPRALALNTTCQALGIDSLVRSIREISSMTWNSSLGVVYIGLDIEGQADTTAGVRALVKGAITEKGKMVLLPMAPESAFDMHTDAIIGQRKSNAHVAIRGVSSLYTSTMLNYVIVLGGPADDTVYQQGIYALPLINKKNMNGQVLEKDFAIHATVASRHALPELVLSDDERPRLLGRRFVQPALNSEDMPCMDDASVAVGGGQITGAVKEIFVRGDAVFAVVNATQEDKSGIFYSRALFDEWGKIKTWTCWQPVTKTEGTLLGYTIDMHTGNSGLIQYNSQKSACVKQLTWGLTASNTVGAVVAHINEHLAYSREGIESLFDLPVNNTNSLMVACSKSQLYIAPIDAQQFITPTVIETPECIAKVGHITSAVLMPINSGIHLLIGGSRGLAIVKDAIHEPRNTTINKFFDLHDNKFHSLKLGSLGSYRFIRKLIVDHDYLYVLTDKKVDRIDLKRSNFDSGSLSVTTIADVESLQLGVYGAFFDLLVSYKAAFLATSQGLFRIGNGKDIAAVQNTFDAQWVRLLISQEHESVERIHAISKTGNPQDICSKDPGNIYVLSCSRKMNQMYLYRFSVGNAETEKVTDALVQPIPDRMKDTREIELFCPFKRIGHINTTIGEDGALFLSPLDKAKSRGIHLINGQQVVTVESETSGKVNALVRSSVTGSWLLAGDFGLRIHE